MKHILMFALLAICACTAAPEPKVSGPILIDDHVWSSFQNYLSKVSGGHAGAFAVTLDGHSSYGLICPDLACVHRSQYKRTVLERCRDYGRGDCIVFAFGRDILVDYKKRL
jgi:hypothetical protein